LRANARNLAFFHMADTPIRDRIANKQTSTRRARLLPALAFAVFSCAMVSLIAASGWFGAQAGNQELLVKRTATVGAIVVNRFQQGLDQLNAGKYELAQASFEEVLIYQPANVGAQNFRATAVFAQKATSVPPTIAPIAVEDVDKPALLSRARAAAESKSWDDTISLTEQLTGADANFESATVAALRWDALTARGLQRLRGKNDQIESGLFDLSQAAIIKPLPSAVEGERRLAQSYQTALGLFGADWDRAIALLSQLPPGYRDVGAKIVEGYLTAGDAYASLEQWCPAAKKYSDALRITSGASLEGKQREAAQRCATATPEAGGGTPVAPVAGMTVVAASGQSGRISFNVLDPVSGQYRAHALDLGSSTIVGLSQGFGAGSVSAPDGARYVEAATQGGASQLVVRTASGQTPLVPGSAPQWGPSGLIAYTGCTDACGIHLINPDQPGSERRLTNSPADTAYKWSPQGDRLIYMSNANGPYELYTASVNGEFRQLTGFGASTGAPAWSPDGGQIAFVSNRDGVFGLYIMNADGSNAVKLVDFGALTPLWQGPAIAWTR
jgi:tetratricopeptide (TPR) repeat protein